MVEIKYYTKAKISPQAREVLAKACDAVFPNEPVSFTRVYTPGPDVLCFGENGGVRVVAPRQITRSAYAYTSLVEGLTLIRDGVTVPIPTIHVLETAADVHEVLDTSPYLAVYDIENNAAGEVISVAFRFDDGTDNVYVAVGDEACRIVAIFFQTFKLVAHNGKYDAKMMKQNYDTQLFTWFDTMVAKHVLNPAQQGHYGLKELAHTVLGVGDWESDIKQYTGRGAETDYGKIPQDKLIEYNAWDVQVTYYLYKRFAPLVADEPAFAYEMKVFNFLSEMEENGVAIDLNYLHDLELDLTEEMERVKARLPEGLNPNSPKQILEYLRARGSNITSTSKATLDTLKKLTVKYDDFLDPLLEYRGLKKQLSTYVQAYRKMHQNGIIHASFNVHGTSSGRLSSSNPNLQNVPRNPKLRRIFIPRSPERRWVEVDYAQGELRVQAILSKDEALIAAFQPDSPDFFDQLMPITFPGRFPTLQAYLDYERDECHGDEKDYRAKVKAVIYGLNFGRQARAIAQALDMHEKEAELIIRNFMEAYPTYARWRETIMEAATNPNTRHMLTSFTGQHFEFEVVTLANESSIERSALSFLPQATLAGLCTLAGIRVHENLLYSFPESKLVLLVHDAIYVDALPEDAEAIGQMVKECMQDVGIEQFGTDVIFTAEPKITDSWGGDLEDFK